jgi:hypothetical protein
MQFLKPIIEITRFLYLFIYLFGMEQLLDFIAMAYFNCFTREHTKLWISIPTQL